MTRVITIISGKGGVGKTSLTSNLAAALAQLGEDVTVIDANLTLPDLGMHLGMYLVPTALQDVLRGASKLKNAVYHHPLGFKVVPGALSINGLDKIDPNRLPEVTLNMIGRSDYLLLDSAAGLGQEARAALSASQEVLIVTNPDLPSVINALKTIKTVEKMNKKIIGVVVNKVSKKSALNTKYIEELLGLPVLVEIPEDENLPKSIEKKNPLVNENPESPAAVEIMKLAHIIVGKPFKRKKSSFLKKLTKIFR